MSPGIWAHHHFPHSWEPLPALSLCLSLSDVDECATGLAQCAHGCLNTQGSFKCVCHAGYELGADGRQCYRELVVSGGLGSAPGANVAPQDPKVSFIWAALGVGPQGLVRECWTLSHIPAV